MVINPYHFAEHCRAVARIGLIETGNEGDIGGGEILMVQCPALLDIDETDTRAVGQGPSPHRVDPNRCRRQVTLVGEKRIVGRIDRRRRWTTFDVSDLHVAARVNAAGELRRVNPRRRIDRHVRLEQGTAARRGFRTISLVGQRRLPRNTAAHSCSAGSVRN